LPRSPADATDRDDGCEQHELLIAWQKPRRTIDVHAEPVDPAIRTIHLGQSIVESELVIGT
jgi:hypothetical protein